MAYDFKTNTVTGWTSGGVQAFPAELRVRFQTPMGVMDTREEAILACERNDLLPELCVTPVVVAEGVDRPGAYEVLR